MKRRSLAPSQVNKRPLIDANQSKRTCMKYNGESLKPEQNLKKNEKLCGTLSLYVSK